MHSALGCAGVARGHDNLPNGIGPMALGGTTAVEDWLRVHVLFAHRDSPGTVRFG